MSNVRDVEVREMLLYVVRSLVDHPEDVRISTALIHGRAIFKVQSHPSDLGKVIGKAGRTARALRVILSANAVRLGHNYVLDIVDPTGPPD